MDKTIETRRTYDGLLPETWETLPLGHRLYTNLRLEDYECDMEPPSRKFIGGYRCPRCSSKLKDVKLGPIVESRHSIYSFRVYKCFGCHYLHVLYYLDLGGL